MAFITNLSDSGIIFQARPILGKKFWQDAEQGTGLLTWKPVFGYVYGKTVVARVKEGNTKSLDGNYLRVWKKEDETSWKIVLDLVNIGG